MNKFSKITKYFIFAVILGFFLVGFFSSAMHTLASSEADKENPCADGGNAKPSHETITGSKNNQTSSLMLCCFDQRGYSDRFILERNQNQISINIEKNTTSQESSSQRDNFPIIISLDRSPPQKESLSSIMKKE